MQLGLPEFSRLMQGFADVGAKFAVASSGGPDSLALTLLAADWAHESGRHMVCLTVDHGLRAESAQESQDLHEKMQTAGIEHHILRWEGEKPVSGIQAAARQARYALLENWCMDNGIQDLMVAHHLDDQAETFLLRLARGSGVDGLAAMRCETEINALRILRPLLGVPKDALITYLKSQKQSWVEDPSNENTDFDRVKIRQNMGLLAELGLDHMRLAKTAQSMQRASDALNRICSQWIKAHVALFEEGYVVLERGDLFDQDEELVLRILSRIGMVISGEDYPPRLERLHRMMESLIRGENATLMGCRWIVRNDDILVCREVRSEEIAPNLYKVDIHHFDPTVHMRILGEEGWMELRKWRKENGPVNLPMAVIYALVSFWDEDGLLAVPHLGYIRDKAEFRVELALNAKNRLFS